jgi:hypothetical protein
MPLRNLKYYGAIVLFCIPLFFLNVRDVHSWGDDFAQYVKEGQNFAHGLPYYQSQYVYNDLNYEFGPPSYPPGFPLLLAPVIKSGGLAVRPMLYLISICMAGLMFALFAFFRKYMGSLSALCLAIAGTYSGYLIDLKANILADIPLTLFTTLYLLVRNSPRLSIGRIVLLILLAVMAMLIRSQAIVLLMAELVFFLITFLQKSNETRKISFTNFLSSVSLKVFFGSLALYLLLIKTVLYNPLDSWGFYLQLFARNKGRWMEVSGHNFTYLAVLLTGMLHFTSLSSPGKVLVQIIEYTGLVFSTIGLLFSLRKRPNFETVFYVLMCAMIISLSVYQGLRYLLPVLPVYLLYCYKGARAVFPRVLMPKARYILPGLTLLYLIAGYDDFNKALMPDDKYWTPYSKEDSTAFKYIIENLPDTAIIAFSKPRALALYTHRRSMVIGQASAAANKRKFDSLHVNYMLIKNDVEEGPFRKYLNELHPNMDSVIIAPNFI